ncbi:hypothetical protein LVO79_21175 (plasmid) [Roseivivax marinus]|uniref:hypothetical protein n=1 Tax=Roseivivax marinus TaxID=1379903 RepID=UPI001F05050D|nr:hypothetical protein [Roseivivax marinus]UMA67308.1 hypothetical protein LVO79_21175 [Roseivivax marinus]
MSLGMKASVRISSLTLGGSGPKTLGSMESHGKRLDGTSQARRVRDREPLVYGSLDLRSAYDEHVSGARMNRGLKRPVMHALIQFPKFKVTDKTERLMLKAAVDFIQETHGGDAVFAARLDRDEKGQSSVDVFYSPKYEKHTKARGAETWVSTSKHGKLIAEKHRDEIIRRSKDGTFSTGPRQVGMAMQSELIDFLRKRGLKIEDKKEKDHGRDDRLEPEAYQLEQDQASVDYEKVRIRRAKKTLKAQVKELKRRQAQVAEDASEVAARQMQLKATEREITDEVRALRKAVPMTGLGEKTRKRIIDGFDRMKSALKRLGVDLDEVGSKTGNIIDRNYKPDPENDRSVPRM